MKRGSGILACGWHMSSMVAFAAILVFSGLETCRADVTDTVDLGTLSGGSYISLVGSYSALCPVTDILGAGGAIYSGGVSSSLGSSYSTGYNSGNFNYNYNFSFGKSYISYLDAHHTGAVFDMSYKPFGSAATNAEKLSTRFELVDETSGQYWGIKYRPGETSLQLLADIPMSDLHDKFTIKVSMLGLHSGASGGFSLASVVPVPSTLILFGTAMASLGLYGAYRRRSTNLVPDNAV